MGLRFVLRHVAAGAVIVRSMIGLLGGEPAQATEVAYAIASGQLTCQVDVSRAGPPSMIHAMNAMRRGLSDIVAKASLVEEAAPNRQRRLAIAARA